MGLSDERIWAPEQRVLFCGSMSNHSPLRCDTFSAGTRTRGTNGRVSISALFLDPKERCVKLDAGRKLHGGVNAVAVVERNVLW